MEKFSQLVSDLIEAIRNFISDFLHKTAKNFKSHHRLYKKYCFDSSDIQKNIHLVTLSL